MATTLNHDISGLCRRIDRFIMEMIKCVSSSTSLVNQFDQIRLMTYITALRNYHGWIMGQPQLDLPETHPRVITLEEFPEVPEIENESVFDVINMLELCRDELVNCQSSRTPAGLVGHDSLRFLAIVDKIEAFLKMYIESSTPLDFPETSPQEENTGSGLLGI